MNRESGLDQVAGEVLEYAVFDLDGTLLRANSFHLWLCYLIADYTSPLVLIDRLKVIYYATKRAFKLIDHFALKRNTMALRGIDSADSAAQFVERYLLGRLSRVCREELNEHRLNGGGRAVMLATAAPRCYAIELARIIGMDAVVATTYEAGGNLHETIKDVKLWEVLRIAGKASISHAYTDHEDDFALLEKATHKILVNPSPATVEAAKAKIAYGLRVIVDI